MQKRWRLYGDQPRQRPNDQRRMPARCTTFSRQQHPARPDRSGRSAIALTGYFCDRMRTDTQTPTASRSHGRTLPIRCLPIQAGHPGVYVSEDSYVVEGYAEVGVPEIRSKAPLALGAPSGLLPNEGEPGPDR
jgi:hypothetical protein